MEKRRKKSDILGPAGRLLIDTKPVGGRIPKKEYDEWTKFKARCSIAGIQLSPYGMLDMLQTYNRINEVIFPLAGSYDFQPIEFKNDVLDIILNSLKELGKKEEWKNDSAKVKENIKSKLDHIVKVSITD